MADLMLRVELLKSQGGFTLDAEWAVEGGVVALFGPSGAGKTLTLQCLAGLVRPDGGLVQVRGRTLFDSVRGINQPVRDRRLGMVFQGSALFPHLTVAENIAYGLHRLPRAERARRTEEWLGRLDLAPVAHLRPAALAGGQQQRVALARALAPEPDLLLLDEPLAALPAPLRRQLREELAVTLRRYGRTAVVVTHDLAEACQLADHIVVYNRGRVVQAGPKEQILARPASAAVAEVLGARNVLDGVVESADPASVIIRWRGQRLGAAHRTEAGTVQPGAPVTFVVPPEHVRLMRKDRDHPPADRRENLIPGAVVAEVDLGDTVLLRFRVDAEGSPVRGSHDLELLVSRLAYQHLGVGYDHNWAVTIQPGAIQLLPSTRATAPGRRLAGRR